MHFSASTGGFYDINIHGDGMPADAVEISDDDYNALMAAQSAGESIVVAADGQRPASTPRLVTVDDAARSKRREINAAADAALASITTQYPRAEIDSWQIQLAEANAYTADQAASTPFIDGLVARRQGVDKPTLVSRILANAAAWSGLSSDVFGQRQALDDLVDAAATVEAVEAIVVSIEVPA